jgi:hypothetical protein
MILSTNWPFLEQFFLLMRSLAPSLELQGAGSGDSPVKLRYAPVFRSMSSSTNSCASARRELVLTADAAG